MVWWGVVWFGLVWCGDVMLCGRVAYCVAACSMIRCV